MFAEILLPDIIMGLIGLVIVIGCIAASFALGSPASGWIMVAVSVVVVPGLFILWLKTLEKYFSLKTDQASYTGSRMELAELVGKQGVAVTMLRPVGLALIEGKRIDVVAAEGAIENGTAIKVVEVKSNRVLVRAVSV